MYVMASSLKSKEFTRPRTDFAVRKTGAETNHGDDGNWWLIKHVVQAGTLAATLAAAWTAGRFGIAAFWVVVVAAVLLVAGTTYPLASSRRPIGVLGGFWSEMVDVFNCRKPTLKARTTQPTWSLTSSLKLQSDVLPSWVRT